MIKINILFINIDGVLNTERYLMIQSKAHGGIIDSEMQFNFDPIAMDNLKEIINKTNAKIIVFSYWKNYLESRLWKEFLNNMEKYGLKDKIMDITPKLEKYNTENKKYEEIEDWLNNNKDKNIEKFIIIDDELEMGTYTNKNYVKCWSYSGLCNNVKNKVLEFFSEC